MDKKRERLEAALDAAVLNLLEHTGAAAVSCTIGGTKPTIFVLIGDAESIASLSKPERLKDQS